MLKKMFSYLGIFILACFSFFYTDKATDIIKKNDPIMKKIISYQKNYKVLSVNAIINNDEIIPGINGYSVNINKSYQNMKKINNYNESMYVFKEIEPIISITNEYDKYIIKGNNINNNISLVFKVYDISYLKEINDILINKNTVATFFIDGNLLENNFDSLLELINNKNEIENLGYDENYEIDTFTWTNNTLFSITKTDPKYCYTDYKNSNILKLCSKNKMYTIKPTVSVTNYPFITVKNNLNNGNIISFNLNDEVIKELPSIISFIKQKGYNLVDLKTLLSEKNVLE